MRILPMGRTGLRNLRNSIHFRARECRAYKAALAGSSNTDQTRVVIFAQGRTGSTLLESLLASTGHFEKHGEILSCDKYEIIRPLAYTLGRARICSPDNFLFHVKIYQLTRDRRRPIDPGAFLRSLHLNGWNIIYLRRSNLVRHAMSTLVAEGRGNYHRFEDNKERLRLVVDPQNFRRLVKERQTFQSQEIAALGELPRVDVEYEADLESADFHQETANRILEYIGLEPRPVSSRTLKVNRFPPQDLIRNYDEIDDLVARMGLSW